MKCPECQAENPKGAKFCGECAEELPPESTCPKCGNANPLGQRFCNECAHLLIKPGTPPEPLPRVVFYITAGSVLVLIAFEISALILWVPGAWNEKLTAVLAIVGLYGLAIGLFSRSAALVDFREGLTSPNPLNYVGSNFFFISFPFVLVGQALRSYNYQHKIEGYPVALGLLGRYLYYACIPFLFAYAVFHMLVVMVLSYLPVVLASVIVAPIVYSSDDVTVSIEQKEFSYLAIVKKDPVATKGFLIGVPALLVSILSAISAPFIW